MQDDTPPGQIGPLYAASAAPDSSKVSRHDAVIAKAYSIA
jgi:hypothetical protein